jgi:hypothetical protein
MLSSSRVRLGITVAVAATLGAVVFGVLPAIAQDGLEEAISTENTEVEEVESEDESAESEDSDESGESEDSAEDSTGAPDDTFGAWVSDRAHELGKDSDGRAFGSETSAAAREQNDDAVEESDDSESVEESADESGSSNGHGNGNGNSNSGKND